MTEWRERVSGAFVMGLRHGAILRRLLLGIDAAPARRGRDESLLGSRSDIIRAHGEDFSLRPDSGQGGRATADRVGSMDAGGLTWQHP